MTDPLERLRRLPPFRSLPYASLARLTHEADKGAYQRGALVLPQQGWEHNALIVIEGAIEAVGTSLDGREVSVLRLQEGAILDPACLGADSGGFFVVAAGQPTLIYSTDWGALVAAATTTVASAEAIVQQLRDQIARVVQLAIGVALGDAESRVLHLLYRLASEDARNEVRYTLEELGRMSATSEGRVSRVIADLQRRGIVTRRGRGRLTIRGASGFLAQGK